jgi:hypothetical protein
MPRLAPAPNAAEPSPFVFAEVNGFRVDGVRNGTEAAREIMRAWCAPRPGEQAYVAPTAEQFADQVAALQAEIHKHPALVRTYGAA